MLARARGERKKSDKNDVGNIFRCPPLFMSTGTINFLHPVTHNDDDNREIARLLGDWRYWPKSKLISTAADTNFPQELSMRCN